MKRINAKTRICTLMGWKPSHKLLIEVPHQREAYMYDTGIAWNKPHSEYSSETLAESMQDLNRHIRIKNLHDLKKALGYSGHQCTNVQKLALNWAVENLSDNVIEFLEIETK